MDEFSYLSVLISVILGLAVTQILKGFRGILLTRARVRIYWPVLGWATLLLLVCFQHWWAMFGMRHRHEWSFEQFGVVLLNVIFIYMTAGLVFPDFFGDDVIDLKESFYAHRGWFFSLGVGTIVVSVCKSFVLDRAPLPPTDLAFHGIFGLTLLVGAVVRAEWYHKALVVFTWASFVCYIVLLYARMQ